LDGEERLKDVADWCDQVKTTMRGIKQALTERWYSWEDARVLARDDPEIQFNDGGVQYIPQDFEDGGYASMVEAATEGGEQQTSFENKAEGDVPESHPVVTEPAEQEQKPETRANL